MPDRIRAPERTERRQRDTRLNLRTSSHQQQLIRRAAEAVDKSVTDFVLDSATVAAEQVLADRRWFTLAEQRWTQFQALLDAPTADTPKAAREWYLHLAEFAPSPTYPLHLFLDLEHARRLLQG